jgi:hypothetical protein
MIRTHNGHTAFSDLHDYFIQHRDNFADWWASAYRAAEGVALSKATIRTIEKSAGRSLTQEEALAAAWIVNICIDIEGKLRDKESRSLSKIAHDDAIAVVRTNAIVAFTKLPPHAAAQIPVVLTHIHSNIFQSIN